jgi:hypothetical protein
MPVRPLSRGYEPWNKELLVGQKKPLEPKHVWSIRIRLEIALSKQDLTKAALDRGARLAQASC